MINVHCYVLLIYYIYNEIFDYNFIILLIIGYHIINDIFIFVCILSAYLQMAPGNKHRPPVIPKLLEENLNPGQIDVELKLTCKTRENSIF